MKKTIIILLLGILFLTGCEDKKEEKIDYSEYAFSDVAYD